LAALAGGVALLTDRRARAANTNRDVPWLSEVQRPPASLPSDAPRLSPLLVDSEGEKIFTLESWQRHRATIRGRWQSFLGKIKVDRPGPPAVEVVEEDRPDGVVRQLVKYEAEPGVPVSAYLLKPAKIRQRSPAAVVLHSTVRHTIRQPAGLEGNPAKAFGLQLARRGFVTLCPRCFLWTDDLSIGYHEHVRRFHARHPQCKGMARMLLDAIVAVDILAAMPEVDPKRLAAVGHSLGAKEVLYLAAFDERIRATVSSEGGIGTRFSNWDAPWYLSEKIRDESFPHEHHELLALVAPRTFLLIGGDSADGDRSWPFIEAVLPVYRLYGAAPRLGLYNHKQGHSVPPEAERRIYEWLTTYC
jgi:dienelactone hydrolase